MLERLKCMLVKEIIQALRRADDPEPVVAEGRWYGEIVDSARGAHGFGYDPHFWLPELDMTAAQLEPAHKNRISHRGLAMAELARKLRAQWSW